MSSLSHSSLLIYIVQPHPLTLPAISPSPSHSPCNLSLTLSLSLQPLPHSLTLPAISPSLSHSPCNLSLTLSLSLQSLPHSLTLPVTSPSPSHSPCNLSLTLSLSLQPLPHPLTLPATSPSPSHSPCNLSLSLCNLYLSLSHSPCNPPLPSLSFPITVCWNIQPVSSNNSQPVTSDPGGHVSDIINTCHTLSSTGTVGFEMTFSEKGRYKVEAVFSNKVSTFNASYTFQVVAGRNCTTCNIIYTCIHVCLTYCRVQNCMRPSAIFRALY